MLDTPMRDPAIATLLVALTAAAGLTGAPAAVDEPPTSLARRSGGGSWPTLRGPSGDGKSPETGLPATFPPGGPPVVWTVETGEGYSMPSISRGRLFLFDRRGDVARLTCLESETGSELWRSEYPTRYEDYYGYSNGPRATPVVDGDRVYTFGVEGRLRAHRVIDGALLWEIDTTERFGVVQNFFGAGSTPLVEGGLLLVPVGGSPPGTPRIHSGRVEGNGSGMVAFDKLTGEVRYATSDELASYATPVVADVAGRRLGFHFARGGLFAFDPRSGELAFHFPWKARILESVNAASPVVVGDQVFISETYGPGSALLRVAPPGYEVVWKDPPARRDQSLALHWSTPIHHGGYLYASSGRNSGDAELRAVELATGRVMWKQPGLGRSTLLLVDGHLVVLTEYGRLLLVRATPERYAEMAELTPRDGAGKPLLHYPAWSPPALTDGLLYLKGKGRLLALELIPER